MYWEDSDIKFLVKHNFRCENRNEIVDKLRKDCKNITNPRDGKTAYIGSTWHTVQTKEKVKLGMINYNVLRIIGTQAMKKQDMPIRHETINRRRINTVID